MAMQATRSPYFRAALTAAPSNPLHSPPHAPAQIGKGFERLYETIDDFVVDVPAARAMAAKFTARAVADEVLPPGFLTGAWWYRAMLR
jgi:hypothetical protein